MKHPCRKLLLCLLAALMAVSPLASCQTPEPPAPETTAGESASSDETNPAPDTDPEGEETTTEDPAETDPTETDPADTNDGNDNPTEEPPMTDMSLNPTLDTDVTSRTRKAISLNEAWRFSLIQTGKDTLGPAYDDSGDGWESVNLPHTWNALDGQDGGKNYHRGTGIYRRTVTIPADYAGKSLWMEFQGANTVTTLYINGTSVGQHKGGYSTFRFDVTDYIKCGEENTIAVEVSNAYDAAVAPLSGDFTFFGGIYRNVNLLVCDPVHIDLADYGSSGLFLTQSDVSAASAKLNVAAKVVNEGDTDRKLTLRVILKEPDGFYMSPFEQEFFQGLTLRFDPAAMGDGHVLSDTTHEITVAAGKSFDFTTALTVEQPHLWNGLSDPFRYAVQVQVTDGETVLDDVQSFVGFRTFSVDAKTGFYLNGQSYPLRGVCKHQDRADMGNAITSREMAEDMSLIYELGANTVRLSHYPHAPYVYELCDKYGIVVYTEIPFVNGYGGGGTFDAPDAKLGEFMAVTDIQMTELVKQVYNRPSVAVIGLENEAQTSGHAVLVPLLRHLNELVHTLDPSKLTTQATFSAPGELLAGDLLSWNTYVGATALKSTMDGRYAIMNGQSVLEQNALGRYEGYLIQDYADRGFYDGLLDRPIGLSEYGTGGSIHQHTDDYKTGFSLEYQPEEYQAWCHENWAEAITKMDYLWGTFIWNMFDFSSDLRNEAGMPGVNTKGLVTHDHKTRKDSFYIYKAHWSNEAVLYITGANNTTRYTSPTYFKVYSNCDSVELFIDGKSLGRLDAKRTSLDHVFEWKNKAGELARGEHEIKAVGQYGDTEVVSTLTLCIAKNINTDLVSATLAVDNQKKTVSFIGGLTAESLKTHLRSDFGATFAVFAKDGKTPVTGEIAMEHILRVTSEDGAHTADYTFVKAGILVGCELKVGGAESANPAYHMLDGDDTTRWAYNAETTEIILKLPYGTHLEKIDIHWFGAGRKYYYDILVSTDGKSYRTVASKQNNTVAERTSDRLDGSAVRYIKIKVYGNSAANGWCSIHEITVAGFAFSCAEYEIDESKSVITVPATAVDQITKDEFTTALGIVGEAEVEITNPTGAAYFINHGDTVKITTKDRVYTYRIRFEGMDLEETEPEDTTPEDPDPIEPDDTPKNINISVDDSAWKTYEHFDATVKTTGGYAFAEGIEWNDTKLSVIKSHRVNDRGVAPLGDVGTALLYVTFRIYSDRAEQVGLYMEVCHRDSPNQFGKWAELTVNGKTYTSDAAMPIGAIWTPTNTYTKLGFVELQAGMNEITVTVTDATAALNIYGLKFKAENAVIAWTAPEAK